MGLSSENPNPNLQTTIDHVYILDRMKAARLAAQLIQGNHNTDPKVAAPVHIRTLVQIRPRVDRDCQDHNSAVSGLGAPDTFKHLWGGK